MEQMEGIAHSALLCFSRLVVSTEDAYFESTTGAVVCSSIVALIAILVVIMGSIGTCMPDKRVANPLVQRNPGGQATIPVARAVQPGMAPQQVRGRRHCTRA